MIKKSEVTDTLNTIPGWDVKTMNSHKKMPTGMRSFPDHFLVHAKTGNIVMIEVKTKNDTIKEHQLEYGAMLIKASNKNDKFRYFVLDDSTYQNILDYLYDIELNRIG